MKKLIYLLSIISLITIYYGCNKEDDPVGPGFDPPSAPQVLTSQTGNARVTLNWLTPSNIGGPFAFLTSYRIYRSLSAGGSTFLTSVSGSSLTYTDTTVVNGQTYFYTVAATNEAGESPKSNEVSSTPFAPLGPPQNPTATGQSQSIFVEWDPPVGSAGNVSEYLIYRGSSTGNLTLHARVNAPTEEYLDSPVAAGTTYFYYIKAVNTAGEGQPSAVVSATATP